MTLHHPALAARVLHLLRLMPCSRPRSILAFILAGPRDFIHAHLFLKHPSAAGIILRVHSAWSYKYARLNRLRAIDGYCAILLSLTQHINIHIRISKVAIFIPCLLSLGKHLVKGHHILTPSYASMVIIEHRISLCHHTRLLATSDLSVRVHPRGKVTQRHGVELLQGQSAEVASAPSLQRALQRGEHIAQPLLQLFPQRHSLSNLHRPLSPGLLHHAFHSFGALLPGQACMHLTGHSILVRRDIGIVGVLDDLLPRRRLLHQLHAALPQLRILLAYHRIPQMRVFMQGSFRIHRIAVQEHLPAYGPAIYLTPRRPQEPHLLRYLHIALLEYHIILLAVRASAVEIIGRVSDSCKPGIRKQLTRLAW